LHSNPGAEQAKSRGGSRPAAIYQSPLQSGGGKWRVRAENVASRRHAGV